MNPAVAVPLAAAIAYLSGSIPFGLLLSKYIAGVDIRSLGSGNIGATNVARTVGARMGIAVLLCDCLKGLAPVLLVPSLLLDSTDPNFSHLKVVCAISAIVGHMFPCWIRFKGGKGVATALGVVLVLGPIPTLAAVAVFFTIVGATRFVSLGSILAASTFGGLQLWTLRAAPLSETNWSLTLFSIAVPLLIIVRHRTNIVRLLKGEEPKFRAGSVKKGEEENAEIKG